MILAISKWNQTFVKSENKKLKTIYWVSLPVELSSHGYQSMLDDFGDDAAKMYGTWCALLSVAAQAVFPGILATRRGDAMKLTQISRATGFPVANFETLIEWATDPKIGWLVEANTDFAQQKPYPQGSPSIPLESLGDSSAPNNKQEPEQKQIQDTNKPHQQTQEDGLGWLVGEIENLDLDWEQAFSKLKKFQRRCGTATVGPVVSAATVLISMATDPAMEYDVATSINSGSARKPEPFAKGAIGKAVEHLGISATDAIEVAKTRMVFFNEQKKEAEDV